MGQNQNLKKVGKFKTWVKIETQKVSKIKILISNLFKISFFPKISPTKLSSLHPITSIYRSQHMSIVSRIPKTWSLRRPQSWNKHLASEELCTNRCWRVDGVSWSPSRKLCRISRWAPWNVRRPPESTQTFRPTSRILPARWEFRWCRVATSRRGFRSSRWREKHFCRQRKLDWNLFQTEKR